MILQYYIRPVGRWSPSRVARAAEDTMGELFTKYYRLKRYMHIYIYIYICIHIHTHMYVSVHMYKHVYTYMYIYIYTYTHTHNASKGGVVIPDL